MKEVTMKDYPAIKKELKEHKQVCHLTKSEFQAILDAYNTYDWQPVYETRLYKDFGGEYCLLLELIAKHIIAAPRQRMMIFA
jgi:phosphoribosyl-dephospho-CoA transferase